MVILALGLALVPGLAWLFFYLQEDPHPEPKSLLAAVFVSGGAFAFLALTGQVLLEFSGWATDPVAGSRTLPSFYENTYFILPHAMVLFSIFAFALIEESFKFVAVWLNVHGKPDFDEPIDAMIYMVAGALGFATVENIGAIAPDPGQPTLLAAVYETLSLRFVGATLLHALCSGIVGYFWAIAIRDFGAKRFVVLGVVVATVLHTFFNYLIISYGSLVYTLVFVLVIGLFVLHDFEKLKVKTI